MGDPTQYIGKKMVSFSYPTPNQNQAILKAGLITEEINCYILEVVKEFYSLPKHPYSEILIPAIVRVLGYSSTSLLTWYDLQSQVLPNTTLLNCLKTEKDFVFQTINCFQQKANELGTTGIVDNIFQAVMWKFVNSRKVFVEKGNLEIDHWAAVFVSSHTAVVADNSIYSLNSY
ncbi:MAG: hypothetical protein ACRCXZ_01710, partial [Patescibacteria group bacterium]